MERSVVDSAMSVTSLTRLGELLGVAVGIRNSGQRIAGRKRLLDGFVECGLSAEPFLLRSLTVQNGTCFNGHARLSRFSVKSPRSMGWQHVLEREAEPGQARGGGGRKKEQGPAISERYM